MQSLVNKDQSPVRSQATGANRRAHIVRSFGEDSETYQGRADQCLRDAHDATLPQLRQRALIAADRWRQLARQAQRVEARAAEPNQPIA